MIPKWLDWQLQRWGEQGQELPTLQSPPLEYMGESKPGHRILADFSPLWLNRLSERVRLLGEREQELLRLRYVTAMQPSDISRVMRISRAKHDTLFREAWGKLEAMAYEYARQRGAA